MESTCTCKSQGAEKAQEPETVQEPKETVLNDNYPEKITKAKGKELVKIFVLIGISWTVILVCMAWWSIAGQLHETDQMTLYQARSSFQQIVITRLWNAGHGGVYVPITEKTQPNPYLDVPNRDLTTTDGQTLTMVNPAYMTRQISELAEERAYLKFHITSLKPVQPANKPYDWEVKALRSFSKEHTEYYEWQQDSSGVNQAFRYMAPLWTEKPCLKCHEEQGYKIGDIRGGVSVIIPADSLMAYRNSHIGSLIATHFAILILGLFGISIAFLYARQDQFELRYLILKLQRTLNEVKTLKGLIPICAHCKKIRTDHGYWEKIEKYLRENSEAKFTHGICPECAKEFFPEIDEDT